MHADYGTPTMAKTYLKAMRQAFASVRSGRWVQLSWAGPRLDLTGFRGEFMQALNRRINHKGQLDCSVRPWRKLDPMYQTELMRDCHAIRANRRNRIAIHQIMTSELRVRFGHLISDWRD